MNNTNKQPRHEDDDSNKSNKKPKGPTQGQLRQQKRHRRAKCKILGCTTCQSQDCSNGKHNQTIVTFHCKHCGELLITATGPFYRGRNITFATKTFLEKWPGLKPITYDKTIANFWITKIPEELWTDEIMPYLSVKELSLSSNAASHFREYWKTFKTAKKFIVPTHFPTIRQAVNAGAILNRRQIIISTNEDALEITVKDGVYNEFLSTSTDEYENHCNPEPININFPVKIIGESRANTVMHGGFNIANNESNEEEDFIDPDELESEEDVVIKRMTICHARGAGVVGYRGASFHLEEVLVKHCRGSGVVVIGTHRNTLSNCDIYNNWENGIMIAEGKLTIDGTTIVHHNGWSTRHFHFGLFLFDSRATLHIVSPLTRETVFKDNNLVTANGSGGGNYGCQTNGGPAGQIKSFDQDGNIYNSVSIVYNSENGTYSLT